MALETNLTKAVEGKEERDDDFVAIYFLAAPDGGRNGMELEKVFERKPAENVEQLLWILE